MCAWLAAYPHASNSMSLFEKQNMKKIHQNDFFLHPALSEDTWLDCDGGEGGWVLVLQCPAYSLPGETGCAAVSRSTLAGGIWGSLPALGWRDVGGQCSGGQDRISKTGKLLVGRASSCARLSPSPGIMIPTAVCYPRPGTALLVPQSQPDPSTAPCVAGCAGGPRRAEPRCRAHRAGSCPGRPPRAPVRGHGHWVRAARAAENAPSSAHAQALGLRQLPPAPWLATARPGLPAPAGTRYRGTLPWAQHRPGAGGVSWALHPAQVPWTRCPACSPLGTIAHHARGARDGWHDIGMAPGSVP